ncbi:MAG: hypothetical protein WBG92_00265 [Thiohalocapsa sp.]
MQTEQTRLIRRHSAYFRGWAQAFGAHELVTDDKGALRWLLGEEQLGLILTPVIRRSLGRLATGSEGPSETGNAAGDAASERLLLTNDSLRLGALTLPITGTDTRVIDLAAELLNGRGDLHLYQSYHLIYPSGTRILSLSRRAPLTLIYREVVPLRIAVELGDSPKLRSAADAC